MVKRKEREVEKHNVNPCNDLDGASRRDNAEKVGTPEKKDEQKKSRILMNLRNKELIPWMKQ